MSLNIAKARTRTVVGFAKHGLRDAPEYENWHNMKQRCLNPNFPGYARYGGRGVTRNGGRFAARVWVNYKPYGFGYYETAEEAAYAYDQAVMQIHGEDVFTNFDYGGAA